MIPSTRADVRALIAAHITAMHHHESDLPFALHDAQREAVRRAHLALQTYGGVLLADDVGTGKTFIALALAQSYARPIVVAPAGLRVMWEHTARRTGIPLAFTSVESLHTLDSMAAHDLVIVDESHHLRNPATRRYRAAQQLLRGKSVVLLSATAIHNRSQDLDAQLALFLGVDAADANAGVRSHVIVRTPFASKGPKVVIHPPSAIEDVDDIVGMIEKLPSPIAPHDGGDAPSLVRIGFLRAWCSSAGAALVMTRRAHLRGAALLDMMRRGERLTRSGLQAWIGPDDDQLGLTGMFDAKAEAAPNDLSAAEAYIDAIGALRVKISGANSIDDHRADRIRAVLDAHPGVPVLACSQFAGTIDALWQRLRHVAGCAALTARGARIASGPIAREHALARFAPVAMGRRVPHERERIRLLLSTDLVSEGLNLQDAGVVIHLDTPWTAARLAQRVGRIARIGSPHEHVHTYTIAAPRAAAALLALERRVATKQRIAGSLVGGTQRVAQLIGGRPSQRLSAPEQFSRAVEMLRPWAGAGVSSDAPVVCGISAPHRGWLALFREGTQSRLVARIGQQPASADPAVVLRGVEWLVSAEEHWLPANWETVIADVARWISRERGRQLSGAFRTHAARVKGRELATVMTSVAMSLPHERARIAAGAGPVETARSVDDASLMALVIFCRRDPYDKTNRTPVRP